LRFVGGIRAATVGRGCLDDVDDVAGRARYGANSGVDGGANGVSAGNGV
jgi:hypothetical protein